MSQSWLILDRDDTLLDDPGYLSDPDEIRFLPGTLEGLARFHSAGWPMVVVTNQSGVGRGYFGISEVEAVHRRLVALLGEQGVELAGIYVCPHAPETRCQCRKPAPTLAQFAARDLNLELKDSVMVGDKSSDLEVGRAIGSKFVAQIVAKAEKNPLADGHFISLTQLADKLLSS